MRRSWLRAGLTAALCAVCLGPGPASALELNTGVDLDYVYAQENLDGEVNAETLFNQKYEMKYSTSLTTAHDFLGAVRLDLKDAWYTDAASTSRVAPTLELATKGSQLAAKVAYEVVISSTDAYRDEGDLTTYSSNLTFDLEMTPALWPELKLKYQRRRDYEESTSQNAMNSFELSARKDIYGVRLEYNFKREESSDTLPSRTTSDGTTWSAKATYKEILWGGTEFELAYELNESRTEDRTRGVFSAESADYTQILKTRLKHSLLIAPRMKLGLSWEYQFDQDLLALEYDYQLKNKYLLDLRWDTFDWLKITGEARRETDLTAAVHGEDDERTRTDTLKAGFDLTSISWLRVSGKAELKNAGKVVADSGGSVDKIEEEKYELIVKNRFGSFWDLTVDATTSNTRTDNLLTDRETKVKADLKLKLYDLAVTPSYEVSRATEWERAFEYPINQQQIRDAKIKFDYQMQLFGMFKATFSHEYGLKIDDQLDEVLNFERVIQFNEGTRFTLVLAELFRDARLEGEFDRRASDTQDDPDPELVELSYSLKLDWKLENLSLLSSIKYNDKGDTFDDVSFNIKASWKGDRLEVSSEYQFDKIIKDRTEPKDEDRKLNLKLNYRF